MNRHDIFPVQAMTEQPESAIKMEGRKVVFDKKVALLPVDIKTESAPNTKVRNERPEY
jgi:hypothetical protein